MLFVAGIEGFVGEKDDTVTWMDVEIADKVGGG